MKVELPYLYYDPDRRGNVRVFVRRNGRKIRIRETPGTPAFLTAYNKALEGVAIPKPKTAPRSKEPTRGTLGWLATRYFVSVEFRELDAHSQRLRRSIIGACLREDYKGDPMRDCPLPALTPAKVKRLRDSKADKKGAANNRLKYLSALFAWGIENNHLKTNPARDVKRLKYATTGFHTWSVEEVAAFEEQWPIGTKPRLALALLLYTGVRRGDVVTLGRQHVKAGVLRFVPRKTRKKRAAVSEKPILPELARVIAASPTGALTFLETEYGKPYTAAGFGMRFREWCNKAGLRHCSAHGLRKAGATLAAEKGATIHQLMAI